MRFVIGKNAFSHSCAFSRGCARGVVTNRGGLRFSVRGSVRALFYFLGGKYMNCENLENEEIMEALDGMREELAAASGILAIMSAARDARGPDLTEEAGDAADGLKLLVDRQLYRLDKHYDNIAAKLASQREKIRNSPLHLRSGPLCILTLCCSPRRCPRWRCSGGAPPPGRRGSSARWGCARRRRSSPYPRRGCTRGICPECCPRGCSG